MIARLRKISRNPLQLGFLVLACMMALTPNAVRAVEPGASAWDENDHAAVRLISASTAIGDKRGITAGLEFQLKQGWKIYWRSPGDAGLPPIPDWSASENIADTEIRWPVPERFSIFGLETFGYTDAVVLPLNVTLREAGVAARLAGTVNYLACEEICVPYEAKLSLDLPAGETSQSRFAHEIDRYRAQVPIVATGVRVAGLSVDSLSTEPDGENALLKLEIVSDQPLTAPDILIEGLEGTHLAKPNVDLTDNGTRARFTITVEKTETATLETAPLTLTIVDGTHGVEVQTRVDQFQAATLGESVSPVDAGRHSLAIVLLLAVLGGLILNLMPCVLPVLSLKVISVVSKGGKERTHIRAGFLATAAGILSAFMVLAMGVVGVKAAGLSVGWGIQFQQPVFLAFTVALLTLFACNMIGLFEFRLPSFIADRAAVLGRGSGLIGDFLTGVFATLLATPCTAPFLGTAVGYALSRGPIEILAVFAALGLGLAIPYLAVAAFPGAAKYLPKPGNWMRWLKFTMAVALAGTGFWLLTVLSAQVGTQNAGAVGFLSIVAALVLATRHVDGSRMGRIAWPLSAMLAILTVVLPLTFEPAKEARSSQGVNDRGTAISWEAFNEGAIRDHVLAGRVVLVDVTADWCVTCQWNKKTVIDQGRVANWLSDPEVIAMRADWTKPNPAISSFLNRHGRYGIPFNIVYGPESPNGIALPELLSTESVMQAAAVATGDPALAARD